MSLPLIAKVKKLKKLKADRRKLRDQGMERRSGIVNPTEQLPQWANPLLKPKRYKVLHGGRGSGKSYAVADALLIEGKKRKCRILCAREFQNSIEESVHQLLSDRVDDFGWHDFYTVQANKISGKNGTKFIFKGVHRNSSSIKSLQGLTHLWIEEAQYINADSWQVLTPTVRNEGSEVWITMNPENESDPIYFEFVKNSPDDAWVYRVNWDQNQYFPKTLNDERLRMKAIYPSEVYEHIWEGKLRRDSDSWQVIPLEWVELAMERWKKTPKPNVPLTAMGVDVARGGKDKTIISRRYGNWYAPLIRFPGSSTPNGPVVASSVVQHLDNRQADIFIDVIGVGSSVYDALSGSYSAYGFGGAEAAQDNIGRRYTDEPGQLEFANLRSWMIWKFRESLNPEHSTICLPPDDILKQDLCAPRWSIKPPIASSDAKGRIAVESKYDPDRKDGLKQRLGRSPDSGDALEMASLIRGHFCIPNPTWSSSPAHYGG